MKRPQAKSSSTAGSPKVRCAIYTRTSSDERLNSDFNSLDAQREACAHYIASRRGDGWTAVETVYSDGGFSGKNTARPALQQLLADIAAGKIDAIVIYKLDRISRSLRDFLSLLETFETHGVACVSISQSFDTKSAMGRLMMNVLLSFAEFEREVCGERIRDKIAASRQRGRWTGGTPILGYDVDRRGASPKLVVNPAEASRTLQIFELYTELGSLLAVVRELDRRGWRNKAWTTRDGRQRGGQPFDKTRLHALLTNPIVIGKVTHKGSTYEGMHEAIVPRGLFDRVQRLLKKNGRGGPELRNKHGALLRGLLFCSHCQRAMVHVFTNRATKCYRYYQCSHASKRGRTACPTRSVPAGEIERLVMDEVRAIGRDPTLVRETIAACNLKQSEQRERLIGERGTLERSLARLRHELALPDIAPVRVAEIGAQIDSAEKRIAEIDRTLSQMEQTPLTPQEVADALRDFDGVWAAMQPKEQARLVHLVVHRVDYDGANGAVAITFNDIGITTLAAEVGATREDAA